MKVANYMFPAGSLSLTCQVTPLCIALRASSAEEHVEIARHHRGASWLDDPLRWRKGMCELQGLHEDGLLEASAPNRTVRHWASVRAHCGMPVKPMGKWLEPNHPREIQRGGGGVVVVLVLVMKGG